jgi:hypothetical protein
MAEGHGGKRPGSGRKAGVPNKVTQSAKEAIQLAAESLGGPERLVAWAQEDPKNETVFWGTIYPKLLPHQVTGLDGAPLVVNVLKLTPPDGD